ncbi:regenerating islet-derived protein 4-like [Egretta garzetta]|uniref:regenerating islet-derived protein 4-like n=1 Tax=Egretta garzetta TaxID=188379 RepID=UPI00163BA8B2|nr:regenerating islet-derived protein 4-like [Egretta garzetta]
MQVLRTRYINYCPRGWSYYKLNCFKYFRQLRSWDEAESQCQASHAGAHLAWVEEPQEAATLQRVISYYQRVQSVWLGLRYGHESLEWQWPNGDKYNVASGLARKGRAQALQSLCFGAAHRVHWRFREVLGFELPWL